MIYLHRLLADDVRKQTSTTRKNAGATGKQSEDSEGSESGECDMSDFGSDEEDILELSVQDRDDGYIVRGVDIQQFSFCPDTSLEITRKEIDM